MSEDDCREVSNFDSVSKAVVWVIISAFVVTLFASVCIGAPAPSPRKVKHKPIVRKDVIGEWAYRWQYQDDDRHDGVLVFYSNGTVSETWRLSESRHLFFLGYWSLERNNLKIITKNVQDTASWDWGEIKLVRDKDGKVKGNKHSLIKR